MRIALGSDHGGFHLKEIIKQYLQEQGMEYEDFGTDGEVSVDYPDFALAVAQKVSQGEFDKGILICGTGIGIGIAANKVPGIRAALCNDTFSAQAAREHNDANILTIGERVVGPGLALDIVATWLAHDFSGGRHSRRVDKISAIEQQYSISQDAGPEEIDLAAIGGEMRQALINLMAAAKLEKEQILVVGCSTSEIAGHQIGTASNVAIAQALLDELLPVVAAEDIFLAIQGCEHINRALVVEKACAIKYNLEPVTVVPHRDAGGALSEMAMTRFAQPVVVEGIQAHAGLDIGNTFIGMHLRPVVVPITLSGQKIGQAPVTGARIRPKLIGGQRAKY